MITKKVLKIILVQVKEGYMSVDDAVEVINECVSSREYIPVSTPASLLTPWYTNKITCNNETINTADGEGLGAVNIVDYEKIAGHE